VARDVADIVLLGDALAPLRLAFESGRAVRRNVRRGTRFLIATNLSEVMLMLFATATGLARPLSPGQLLWINLLTDVLPAMGLALEPPDRELMTAAALSDAATPVVPRRDFGLLLRDGGIIAGSALAAQRWAARRGAGTGATVGFASLMTGQLLYALACRPNPQQLPGASLTGALAAAFAA